jgi:hypothetical protein
MSKLVVNQVQYNGGQVFTLPTASPSAGDFLKTDGSGALGWTGGNTQIKSADGSSKTYTMPANSGSAGQVIKTDGNAQFSYGASSGQNPMQVGNKDGMVLIGNSGDELSNSQLTSHTITCPTEYTTTPSNIIAWKIELTGVRASSNHSVSFSATNQAGTVINETTNNSQRIGITETGAFKQNGVTIRGAYTNMTANTGQMTIGAITQNLANASNDARTNQLSSSQNRNEGIYAEFWIYNKPSKPQWHGWAGYRGYNDDYGFNLVNYGDPTSFSSSYGYPRNEEMQVTQDHPMGWKIYTSNGEFKQGVWQVYAVFKDGVL